MDLATPGSGMKEELMSARSRAGEDPLWFRICLILSALLVSFIFLILPLYVVFQEAFRQGIQIYKQALTETDAAAAIRLTLLTTGIVVPCNTIFGISAAWAITKFRFPGKNLLITLIDLPFAVSPVICGLIYVLLFGRTGILGPYLEAHDIQIIFVN